MIDDISPILAAFDEAGEILRDLSAIILSRESEFATTWECANRVCDRYYPQPAAWLRAAYQDSRREYQRSA